MMKNSDNGNIRGGKEEEEELQELKDPASSCCEYRLADHSIAQAIRQQKKISITSILPNCRSSNKLSWPGIEVRMGNEVCMQYSELHIVHQPSLRCFSSFYPVWNNVKLSKCRRKQIGSLE